MDAIFRSEHSNGIILAGGQPITKENCPDKHREMFGALAGKFFDGTITSVGWFWNPCSQAPPARLVFVHAFSNVKSSSPAALALPAFSAPPTSPHHPHHQHHYIIHPTNLTCHLSHLQHPRPRTPHTSHATHPTHHHTTHHRHCNHIVAPQRGLLRTIS